MEDVGKWRNRAANDNGFVRLYKG